MLAKKALFSVVLILMCFQLHGFGKQEKSDTALKTENEEKASFEKAEKLWKKQDVSSYRTEIIYRRAAFPPERLLVTVKDGIASGSSPDNPDRNYPEGFFSRFEMGKMFDLVRESLENRSGSPMRIEAEYDSSMGYIKKLSRIPADTQGRDSGSGTGTRAPMDANYHIEVLSLEILEKRK